ncbi:MAG: aspartate kinase, partial [Firmicutes bacterium]|nr:aspartate kinase [Candidatus Colimorpha enterica]
YEVLSEKLTNVDHAVIPGFYVTMPNDTIKTFSRGGSDITGSIVAKAARADLYENWTDVSGFLVADPRIVPDSKVIETITYKELRELSYMGATVLHEDAVFPVRTCGIPINIRNTNKPDDPGTMIVAESATPSKGIITGISGKHGFSVITIEKDQMNRMPGFIRKVLSVLENCRISVEHIPSGIDNMSVVVRSDTLEKDKEIVVNNIWTAVEPDSITVENELALIAVVGRGMGGAKGTAARVMSAVASAGVNVKMIDQGSDEINIILGVKEEDFEPAIKAIYKEFDK